MTSLARAIAGVPGALCCFNPNGETLFTAAEMDEMRAQCPPDLPPLPLWCMGRMGRLEEHPPWMFADVLGMQQLDALDHEACFRRGEHDANDVMAFLRNCTQYTLDNGDIIKTGHTIDGPGGIWRAIATEEPILPAPRRVIRWYPDEGPRPPVQLLAASSNPPAAESPVPRKQGGFLSRLKSKFGA